MWVETRSMEGESLKMGTWHMRTTSALEAVCYSDILLIMTFLKSIFFARII